MKQISVQIYSMHGCFSSFDTQISAYNLSAVSFKAVLEMIFGRKKKITSN